jgi:hypothetical protein
MSKRKQCQEKRKFDAKGKEDLGEMHKKQMKMSFYCS